MNSILKLMMMNGGLSAHSGLSMSRIHSATFYNEDHFGAMSDTPFRVGSLERAPAAVAHAAKRGVR